ncbi:MAG: RNA polymerase sigma factor [Candidatus Zixiibacteriota bacterium]
MDDKQLINSILSGNQEAYRIFIKKYVRLVNHVVFKMIANETDREDVCQDVFIKAYQNLKNFKFESKISTWIARIAYNTCINYLEKRQIPLYEDVRSEQETLEDHPGNIITPDDFTVDRNLAYKLCQEIDELPVNYGLILSLYHLQEMSYLEIAKILGMPEGTVKSYLFRARKMLKDRLTRSFCLEDLCH